MGERVRLGGEQLVSRLLLLDAGFPSAFHPPPLNPFLVDPVDPIDLQTATRRIAEHVGLGEMTFVVGMRRLEHGTGGRIELDPSDEVFVEIDPEVTHHSSPLLACLAHEICHKLLAVHRVWIGSPGSRDFSIENERLTDLTVIWSGLGKLMLNGCDHQARIEQDGNVVIRHHRGGYVHRDSLALAYLLVSHLRGASEIDARSGLTDDALEALDRARPKLSALTHGATADDVLREVRTDQELLARLDKEVRWLQQAGLSSVRRALSARHERHRRVQRQLEALDGNTESPSGRLRRIGLASRMQTLGTDVAPFLQAHATLSAVARLRWSEGPPERRGEDLRIVSCGCCDQRLRLPPDRDDLVATCAKCGYRFVVDTTADAAPPREPATPEPRPVPRRSWWSALLGRRTDGRSS